MKCGVPQGSILGPLFFLMYINDLPSVINTKCILYADDTTLLFRRHEDIENDYTLLCEWFQDNALKLNLEKTQFIEFNKKHNQQSTIIHINNNQFLVVDKIKFLGVYIDKDLSWNSHIEYIRKKIRTNIFLLRNLCRLTNTKTTLQAYYGYVLPLLRYGIALWGNSSNAITIFKLQKMCIRATFNLKPRDSCAPYFKKYKILTLPSMYILESALLVKCNRDCYNDVATVHSHHTRLNSNIYKPATTKAFIAKNIYHMAIDIFNNIPLNVQKLPLSKFKKKMKELLISKCYYNNHDFLNDRMTQF